MPTQRDTGWSYLKLLSEGQIPGERGCQIPSSNDAKSLSPPPSHSAGWESFKFDTGGGINFRCAQLPRGTKDYFPASFIFTETES